MKNNKIINNLMKNNKMINIIILVILVLVILYLLHNLFSKNIDNFEDTEPGTDTSADTQDETTDAGESITEPDNQDETTEDTNEPVAGESTTEPEPKASGNDTDVGAGTGISSNNEGVVEDDAEKRLIQNELNSFDLPMRINLNFKNQDYVIINTNDITFYNNENENILKYDTDYDQPIEPKMPLDCPVCEECEPPQTEIKTDNGFTIGIEKDEEPELIYIKDNNKEKILTYDDNGFVMYDYKGRKIEAKNEENSLNIYEKTLDGSDEKQLVRVNNNDFVNNVASEPKELSNIIFGKLRSLVSASQSTQ